MAEPVAVNVRVPVSFSELSGGERRLTVVVEEGPVTVEGVLDALSLAYPALERRIRDERGCVRTHVNLFVGADNIRDLDGLATPVGAGADLSVIAAVSGG